MMFSAGMGIGLMFFGVAEPLSHMSSPPAGTAEAGTREAAQVAMEYSFFHWAFHPWAIYAIMGLALAYFCFRKGMPNLISTAFYPLLGDRVYGPIGKTIDILAIFATLFGSATSLGLGALQINQGLEAVFGFGGREAVGLAIVVIAILTIAFILSAVSGVHRRSEEHTSELQSRQYLVCRLLLEKKKELKSTHELALLSDCDGDHPHAIALLVTELDGFVQTQLFVVIRHQRRRRIDDPHNRDSRR